MFVPNKSLLYNNWVNSSPVVVVSPFDHPINMVIYILCAAIFFHYCYFENCYCSDISMDVL